jgi:hypothetical protein
MDGVLKKLLQVCLAYKKSEGKGKGKGKAIPFLAWTGPYGFRRFRLPHFKKVGT